MYTVIIFASVVIGILLGQIGVISKNAELAILPLLIIMLFIIFFQIPLEEIKDSVKNIKFAKWSLIINFIWTPLLAYILATIFLADHPALWVGFIMLMVTPCTDWYLVFTGLARGNTALSGTILPINLILQLLLLPGYLFLFAGTTGMVKLDYVLEGFILVLVIPFLLAGMVKLVFRKREETYHRLSNRLSPLPIVLLSLAIVAMFASQGQYLIGNLQLLWVLLLPIVAFFIINFIVSQFIGRKLSFSYKNKVSLTMTTLARNSPVALALAITAFPNEPLIALALVIGPLLELPILMVVVQVLLWKKRVEKLQ
nr:bile acid:sodium symporter [Bacillus alkalicola]